MHEGLDGNMGIDVVYQTRNIHMLENELFSDTRHLIKTLDGCLFNSDSGSGQYIGIVGFSFYDLIFHSSSIKI